MTTEWVHMVNGNIAEVGLPEVYELSDGRVVSGYDALPREILQDEGWFVVQDPGPPEYNPDVYTDPVRKVTLRDGEPVVEYEIKPRPASFNVEGDTIRVLTGEFEVINFYVGGEQGQHVPVDVTDDVAELELDVEGAGEVRVWIAELEEEVRLNY